MDSTLEPKQADSQVQSPALSPEVMELVARADQRLAHAFDQIARADDSLSSWSMMARANSRIRRLPGMGFDRGN